MPKRSASSTAVNRSQVLSCAVEPTLAEIVRDLAWQQRSTISVLIGELLREALERRGELSTQRASDAVETTNATA